MLQINQVLDCLIKDIQEDGYAVLRVQKDRLRIPHVLPQEEVKVKVVKHVKDGFIGKVIEYKKKSDYRVKPACGIYECCGSCHMLHINEKAQLELKKEQLIRLCKEENYPIQIHDVVGMKHPYAYRNKIIVGFQKDKRKNICAGFYEEYSHRVIPFKHCLMHDEICDAIIQTIVKLMKQMHIESYEEDKRRGLLRHVLLRKGTVTKEIMVVLVVNSNIFPARKNFVNALMKQHPEITTVVQNVNTRKTSIVLGEEERVLYGSGFIQDELCGLRFRISAKSFYQINHDQCEVLYQKAVGLLELTGKETVIDAYCGIGTIGMYASKFAGHVIGVEVNQSAVKDAKENAKRNKIINIKFVCEDASRYMLRLAAEKKKIDAVIMDPPRAGSNEDFMNAVKQLRPNRVVYISCNPKTQIRDLKYFKKLGYVAKDMYPVDMFPHTYHVETIVLLSHKSSDSAINVKVEFGEGEGKVPLDAIAERVKKYHPKPKITYK